MSDHRPVIGLTTYEEQARWGVWDLPSVLLPSGYVQAVVAGGGLPLLLPPLPEIGEGVLTRLDGLILSGGPDIEPSRYGAEALETTGAPRVDRDEAELELIRAALAAGLPVLGICRGLQLLNVARGGTLHQHLPDVLGSSDHAPAPAVYGHHPIEVTPGSLLAETLARTEAEVSTYHHQAIDQLGAGLTVSAVAPDGTIEAIEDQSMAFCLAVQWHPEVEDDRSLFAALVTAASATAVR
ncbi:MAG TPA: gamma-glutamyl-gamma-aminobutyrate hydrolase family protein [Kineosporiaceae bacterium]|nr:gamma-glutamyl-gamma-aminobutyrate hydrolase family protein [Kineosporiaceae bacterium]